MFKNILETAILAKNIPLVQYLYAQKEKLDDETYDIILEAAAEVGDWGWIVVALEKTQAGGWILRHAAKGGHQDVIDFFLKQVDYSNALLQGYTEGGHIAKAKALMEEQNIAQENLHYALYRAIDIEDKDLIDYILQKIGTVVNYVWTSVITSAVEHSLDILLYVYGKKEKWSDGELEDALSMAIYHEKIDVIRFLLEKGADVSEYPDMQKNMERLLQM